jgi:hypothetical protein
MKDREEIFLTVALHLILQNERSKVAGGDTCMYRGAGGLACAVGVLIDEEHYCAGMEGQTIDHQLVSRQLLESGLDMRDVNIRNVLRCLQSIHDSVVPSRWPMYLQEYEGRFFS